MSILEKFVNGTLNFFGKLKAKLCDIAKSIVEAGRTNSYIETVSNKADTVHRRVEEISENNLKKAFECNTRKAIGRMGLGRVVLAIDPTKELYFGENGKMNVRQIKHEKGADEAFYFAVLSVVKPRPLPLMAIPYKQGDDLTKIIKELIEYARKLPFIIELVLFDREFYIGDLINYLSSVRLKYLIFVRETSAMKRYIAQTNKIKSFNHTIKYNKYKTKWNVPVKIVIIEDYYINKKTKRKKKFFWCFATNLGTGLYLIRKYKQRWQIETNFRVQDEARIKSKSNYLIVRYFYFLTSLILMANWEVNRIAHPEICFKKYLKFVEEQFNKGIG